MHRTSGHECAGAAAKRHEAPVARDRRRHGRSVALDAARAEARAHRRPLHPVVDEDVGLPVRVAGNDSRRLRLEGDEATVGRDRGRTAVVVGRTPCPRHADGGGFVLGRVVEVHVVGLLERVVVVERELRDRVAGHERIARAERDEATVRRERGQSAKALGHDLRSGRDFRRARARRGRVLRDRLARRIRAQDRIRSRGQGRRGKRVAAHHDSEWRCALRAHTCGRRGLPTRRRRRGEHERDQEQRTQRHDRNIPAAKASKRTRSCEPGSSQDSDSGHATRAGLTRAT